MGILTNILVIAASITLCMCFTQCVATDSLPTAALETLEAAEHKVVVVSKEAADTKGK